MSDKTKTCNLTINEIQFLIEYYGRSLSSNPNKDNMMERLNYLHKRLKAFSEPETKSETNAAGWTNSPAGSKGEDM